MRHLPILLLAAASAATAQNTIVSPTVSATNEGSSSNIFPFASNVARRYLQIHSDIGGAVRNINKLTFRPNASTLNATGTYAYDMELFMGHSRNIENASFRMDANYLSPRTPVITRQTVNWGPQGQLVSPGPNPFNAAMALPLSAPFPYDGVRSLVFEVVMYSAVVTGTFVTTDADQSTSTLGTSTITGTGCIATGRAAAMTHAATLQDAAGILVLNFTVTNGPSTAPCLLALGATNPNLSIPGLCSNLYTDLLLTLPIGTTDAAGAITTANAAASTLVLANTFGGATLQTQVHAVDPGQSGLAIANSNGRSNVLPPANPLKVIRAGRFLNTVGGTTATEAIFFTSSIGYALPVEFTY